MIIIILINPNEQMNINKYIREEKNEKKTKNV